MIINTNVNNIDRIEWTRFVENHPHGQVFYLPEMVDLYANDKHMEPLVVAAIDKDKIKGLLLAVIQWDFDGLLGELTKRSIVMGGPLVENNDVDIAQQLLSAYDQAVKAKAIFSQFRNLEDMQWMDEVFRKEGFTYEEHLDFLHDVTLDTETIIAGVDKNKRANIRKSLNKGTTFEEIHTHDEYQQCLELVYGTYKRVGLPCPSAEYFESAWQHLMPTNRMKTFVARFEGVIIGMRMELVCGGNIYDWYAGADDNYKNKYPNDFIPYHILLWGHENGYRIFDFGGAGKPGVPYGVREHKVKFGGELVNYGRYEKVHKKGLMLIGRMGFPIYRAVKKLFMRIK